jgi:hypothetical protein
MHLIVRFVPLALCAVALGACHSSAYLQKHAKAKACVEHPAYLAAQNASALRTPEGLTPPSTKNAMKIGDVSGVATARTTKDGCLDKPPNFFAEQAKPSAAPRTVPQGQ